MMQFTALCVCGTLLFFSSLSLTTVDSDKGDPHRDNGFWPCTITLRPDGLCRQGQDENTCPYIISLPPLTVHLPKQLKELEKIVEDLQKLKENVDQLREMCADCTVSKTERECGRQREREHEKTNEYKNQYEDERLLPNEKNADKLKDFIPECGKHNVSEANTMEGDGDTEGDLFEGQGEKNRESGREGDKEAVKENENEESQQVAQKDGKIQADGAKGKVKLKEATMPSAFGNETLLDIVIKNNREIETYSKEEEEDYCKGHSKGHRKDTLENRNEKRITNNAQNIKNIKESNHQVWHGKTQETEKKPLTDDNKGSDGMKMSEDQDKHTKKEQQQRREERRKELEMGIKLDQNNEEPKQTGSIGRIGKEKTIKEGEGDREMRKIKTGAETTVQNVQGDYDGEFSKPEDIANFVLIPTPHSNKILSPRHNSDKAITFETTPQSPFLRSNSVVNTGVNQGITVPSEGLPTQSTGPRAVGVSEQPSLDTETGFRTTSWPRSAAIITTGPPTARRAGKHLTIDTTGVTFATRPRSVSGVHMQVNSAMLPTTTTTTHYPVLYTTTFPATTNPNHWTVKRNFSSNTKAGVDPLPDQEPMPDEKNPYAIKTEADKKNTITNKDHKSDQVPLPNQKTKHNQKQRPSNQKPKIDQKFKLDQDLTQHQVPQPDQISPPDNVPIDGNLTNTQTLNHDQEHKIDQKQLPIKTPISHQELMLPVHRPRPDQISQTINATTSDIDPVNAQAHEIVEIPIIDQNPRPDNKLAHPLNTGRSDQKQKLSNEKTTKPSPNSTFNKYFTPVQESEPEKRRATSLTTESDHKPVTVLMENSYATPSPKPKSVQASPPGQRIIPDHALMKLFDLSPKPNQIIPKTDPTSEPGETPKLNQKHPDLATAQTTEPILKSKPNRTPQISQWLKTHHSDEKNLNSESVPDEIPEEESNKSTKPLPTHSQRARPTVKQGPTSTQYPKLSVQLKPSPKSKTDLDHPTQITKITSESFQNIQTDMPYAIDRLVQFNYVTHSPGEIGISPSKLRTIPLGPKTSNSMETEPLPNHQTLPEVFTSSPNSRITSDIRPQKNTLPTSIPVTSRPNTIMTGFLPSVFPSSWPGSTKPKPVIAIHPRIQVKMPQNVEENAPSQTPDPEKMIIPVPSPSAQASFTTGPDLRPKNYASSGIKPLLPETSTTRARELRVKINQVAAFFNNSLIPNGKLPESHPTERSEDNQGGRGAGKPDRKLPMLISSKGRVAMRDCSDHLLRGGTTSGVYLVTPDLRSRSFSVFCDMELHGGGWTLLQRRQDGSVSFNRTWTEYRSGFGKLDGGEFWLGNNKIHVLTRDRDMELRVELEDFEGVMEYAEYVQFSIASERMRYRLTVGGYSGTAGDALRFKKRYEHNNRPFTTPDRDHDRYPHGNCGAYYSSGWWFDACMAANLNGRYYVGNYKGVRDGIFWGTWRNISKEYYPTNDRHAFKSVRMMIRPKGFTP